MTICVKPPLSLKIIALYLFSDIGLKFGGIYNAYIINKTHNKAPNTKIVADLCI